MYVFLLYANLYILCSYKLVFLYPLTFSLILPNFPIFIYNVSHNNFYNYFISEYAILGFWNVERRVLECRECRDFGMQGLPSSII